MLFILNIDFINAALTLINDNREINKRERYGY